jgi:3-oxoacyl-(acyl-carrier-protein) synthase
MRPLAITGVGLVSPLGIGFTDFRDSMNRHAVLGDKMFVRESSVLAKDKLPDPCVAEVSSFDPTPFLGSKGLRNHDRLTLFLLVAAKQALLDAGLKKDGEHKVYSASRMGLISATAYGSLDAINELVQVAELEDPRFMNPNRFPNTVINSAAGYVSIWEDLRAPNVTVVDGNCGSLDAMLNAETHLSHNRADGFLVGGGEVLSDPLYLAFRKLGILAEGDRVFQPGSPDGQGMRIGEAAAYFCVEREADAKKRGNDRYGCVIGYGNAFEPPESDAVVVHASQKSIERAITAALNDAGLPASAIDGVVGSLNGVAIFDRAELGALETLFGKDVPVIAPKSVYGETFGCGGALGIACALAWLDGASVGPVVRGTMRRKPKALLVPAVGFYGNVSAVIVTA